MLSVVKQLHRISTRTFKNFGHKRQPEPTITVLWTGFLTFTFMGLLLNWKWVGSLFKSINPEEAEDTIELEASSSRQ